MDNNKCLHRYFTNVTGQPQRMKVCERPSGHEGDCGPKPVSFRDPRYMSSVDECGELGLPYPR